LQKKSFFEGFDIFVKKSQKRQKRNPDKKNKNHFKITYIFANINMPERMFRSREAN